MQSPYTNFTNNFGNNLDSANVWALNDIDVNMEEEATVEHTLAFTSDEISHVNIAIPQSEPSALQRRYDDIQSMENEMYPLPKRVAISGPNQRMINYLREREEISRYRAVEHGVRTRTKEAEIEQLRQEYNAALRQHALDQEVESEMAEQILQYEKELKVLNDRKTELANSLQDQEGHNTELQRSNEEMKNRMCEIETEHLREKERQSNELLALRQCLQSAQEVASTPLASATTMLSRRTRTTIGVVPLRPTPRVKTSVVPEPNPTNDSDIHGTANIAAVVKEVLQQLNVACVTIEERGSSRKWRSVRSRNQKAIVEEKKKIAKGNDLNWKDAVQNAWKCYYNVTSIADFGDYEPAPEDQVEAFEMGQNGPDNSNTLFFGKGFEHSRWNKVTVNRLCAKLLEECEADGSWDILDVSHNYLAALFYSQLKHSREAWRLVQARPKYDQWCIETLEEVVEQVEEYTSTHLSNVGSRSHWECKFQRQVKTVEKVICLKSDAPDLATWEYFRELLQKLSVDGMSLEEEGVEKLANITVPVFHVKLCPWQHPVLHDYFKYIDQESQNPAIRPSRGSKLHPRVYTDNPMTTSPPLNLPEKLFNEEWLKNEETMKGRQWVDKEPLISREVFELLHFVAA